MRREASLALGHWFTQEEDFGGYAPAVVVGVMGLVASAPFGILLSWIPVFIFWAVVIAYCFFGLWLAADRVQKINSHTRGTVKNFNALSENDKLMFPSNTADKLIEHDSIAANDKVNKLIVEIESARQQARLPVLEDFISEVDISVQALNHTKELR